MLWGTRNIVNGWIKESSMGMQQNTGDSNVGFLKACFDEKISPTKKEIDTRLQIEELSERIISLENLIRYIFDGHILLNGQFKKIKP